MDMRILFLIVHKKANRRKMQTNTICVHLPAQSLQCCLTLCDPVDCSLPIQCPQAKEGAICGRTKVSFPRMFTERPCGRAELPLQKYVSPHSGWVLMAPGPFPHWVSITLGLHNSKILKWISLKTKKKILTR